ncbi:MAG TPA: cytochrome c [Blastocatellia bacterium]|nr:cytochrome c [Blastocatellia bacterium]
MKRIKLLIGAGLASIICACLYCPVFHAMPKFMDRYDADPLAKAELKGKCNVCHLEDDGYGPLNTFGKAFEESGYRITDGLRNQSPELFAGGQVVQKPSTPVFDVKAFYNKNCAACHGADGKGGESLMIVPNFKDAAWQKRRTDQNFFDTISKGKGAMPAWKEKMTEEQIKSMAAFIRKFPEQ